MPSPCAADTATGSPSPSEWNSAASGMSTTVSHLFAATSTGCCRAPQQVGDLVLARARAGARVDDQQRHVGVGEPGLRLLADRAGERVLVGEVDAAGVDQRERAPVPLAVELLAVARDPGALVHDRLARAGQPVDER